MRLLFLSLNALLLRLVLASSPRYGAQHHLTRPFDVFNLETLLPLPSAHIRCPQQTIWTCKLVIYYSFRVYCYCEIQPIVGKDDKNETVSSIEVMAELQPGNNQTLVSLFEMQCEEHSFVGCISESGGAFICGCHESLPAGSEDESAGNGHIFKDIEGSGVVGEEESRAMKGGGFQFQTFRYQSATSQGTTSSATPLREKCIVIVQAM